MGSLSPATLRQCLNELNSTRKSKLQNLSLKCLFGNKISSDGRLPEDGDITRDERASAGWGEADAQKDVQLCLNKDYACDCECKRPTDLRGVDSALLEGTAGGVVGAQVAVLAPVAAEGTVHT